MRPIARLLTATEVAALVRKKTPTVVKWARTGKVRAIKSPGGRGWLFHPDDVADLMKAELAPLPPVNEIEPARCITTEQAL